MLKVKFKTGAEAEAFAAALFLTRNLIKDDDLENHDDSSGRFSVHDMILEKGTEKPYTVLIIDKKNPTDRTAAHAELLELDYLPTQPDWHV